MSEAGSWYSNLIATLITFLLDILVINLAEKVPPRNGKDCRLFKAQVKLRFTSAFNKWKFLSIYLSICQLSQVFQISDLRGFVDK